MSLLTAPESLSPVAAQRALEALRNGVPNGDAVRALGCMQPEVVDRFRDQLDELGGTGEPAVVAGTLVAGGFGAGKSHTLAYLEQEALARGFLVSRLVVSKETPLHDLVRLFLAAVREARLPDGRGSALHELAMRVDYRKPAGAAFQDWAFRGQPHGIVAATVAIHERSNEPQLTEQAVGFWSGEKLGVREVRLALKGLGLDRAFSVQAVRAADLAPVRFELGARLARAAGLRGWVLLLDEAELVGRYSLLQRAKAYANLALVLGAVPPAEALPGITAVAAITDDYAAEMLDRRGDLSKVTERLKARGDDQSLRTAARAEAGMALIDRDAITLHLPSDDTLAVTYEKLRGLYERAYGWRPPGGYAPPTGWHRSMRSYIRHWVTTWDLDRLYPGEAVELGEEELRTVYEEDRDLAAEPEGDGD